MSHYYCLKKKKKCHIIIFLFLKLRVMKKVKRVKNGMVDIQLPLRPKLPRVYKR